jgi:hypothetical protein
MDAFMREYAALDPEFESVMTVKSRAEALEAAGLREQAMSQENVEIVRRAFEYEFMDAAVEPMCWRCFAHPRVLDAALGYYREVSFEGLSKLSQPALVLGGATDIWDPELFNRSPEASTALRSADRAGRRPQSPPRGCGSLRGPTPRLLGPPGRLRGREATGDRDTVGGGSPRPCRGCCEGR